MGRRGLGWQGLASVHSSSGSSASPRFRGVFWGAFGGFGAGMFGVALALGCSALLFLQGSPILEPYNGTLKVTL